MVIENEKVVVGDHAFGIDDMLATTAILGQFREIAEAASGEPMESVAIGVRVDITDLAKNRMLRCASRPAWPAT
ncbi:MAG: hypothetical protein AB1331_08505 [Bacillota bacterium]